jgi:3D (Asp-Asp-Asp) domain-containing protein
MAAADPNVLPLGSVVRIVEPQRAVATLTITDTGGAIKGQRLDIFMADCRRAVRFGRKKIVVRVVRVGGGAADAR